MENDPLQQLRDVQLPQDPSWWPPAIGWWLLCIAALVLVVWLMRRALGAYRRRAPLRRARTLLTKLHADHTAGAVSDQLYLHSSNEILKRVLVRAYGRNHYAPMAGEAWLNALDQLGETTAFTSGPGRALGQSRFSPSPEVDVAALHDALQELLRKVPA